MSLLRDGLPYRQGNAPRDRVAMSSSRQALPRIAAVLLSLSAVGLAQGPGTMLHDRFGVTLQLQASEDPNAGRSANGGYPFDWPSFVPTENVDTTEWTESDWIGAWFNNFSESSIQHATAPGSPDQDWNPSGGEPYDVEAMYFDNDATNYYFAIVTSIPHYTTNGVDEDVGVVDPRDSGYAAAVRSGDLAISFFTGTPRDERDTTEWHYNYGVNITQENRDNYTTFANVAVPTMRSLALGTGLYQTSADAGGSRVDGPDVASDWYTSSAPPSGGSGTNATTESDWEHTNFDPLATSFTGAFLGNVTVNYYDVGLLENDYATYVYEYTIPRALFGNNDRTHGEQIGFRFNPGCRNDGNSSGQGSVSLIAVVDDLEMGDLIFEDLDDDGVYEPGSGESGINGVTVQLFESGTPTSGDPYAATTTSTLNGNAGRYRFRALPPGDYYIHVPSTEFQSGGDLEGMISSRTTEADPDDDENEDGTGANGTGSTTSTVGGTGDENGIDEAAPASNGISTGVFTLSAGAEPTGEDSAGIQATALDANSNLSIDLGFFAPANIEGTTYEDTNSDGSGDQAINVTTIRLFAADGTTPIDNPNVAGTQDYVITTTDGTYAFVNLAPGSYIVEQDQPTGYQTVSDLDSTADAGGSPADPANSSTSDNQIPAHVGPGETDTGNDFIEEAIPVVIGNYVWLDANGDGFQASEAGISGVVVRLLDAGGSPVTIPGTPSVVYADNISGYTLDGDPSSWAGGGSGGWPAEGPWIESQSGVNTDGTSEGRVRIEDFSGDQMLTLRNTSHARRAIDLSSYASATISFDYERYNNNWTSSDEFIVDYSTNGGTDWTPILTLTGSGQDGSAQATGELNLPVSANMIRVRTTADAGSKRIRLNNFVINAALPVPLTATTDGSGFYTFGNSSELSSSTGYRVSIDTTQSALAGYVMSPTDAGGVTTNDPTGDDSDSDASASGDEAVIVLTSPAIGSNLSYDFGFTCPLISLDTIDSNPLPNGTVSSTYNGALTASGGTSPYTFALKSGSALPAGLTMNTSGTITGTPTAPASSLNFTVVATDDVGCTGEATFTISVDCNSLVITPTTLANGQVGTSYGPVNFSASGATGSVSWSQTSGTLPAGLTFAGGTLSGTPTEGGSFSFSVGASDQNSCSGSVNLTLDIPIASIAGTTFEDTDNDDDGDVPVNVTTVRLLAADGTTPVDNPNIAGAQDYVITTTDGTYQFLNLTPGSYVVSQDQPSGYLTVTDLDSSADAGGSPTDPINSSATDNQIPANVGSGETDGGNDFVEERPGSISGSIYHDVAGDGSPSGDPLLTESLTIELWTDPNNDGDPSDGVKSSEVTVTNGTYAFTNLEPGDYLVMELDPNGYGSTGDIDGVSNGYNTVDVELTSGESDTGNDFYDTADAQLASVSGTVYLDSVDDGALTLSGGSVDTAVGGSPVMLYLDTGTVAGDLDAGDTLLATTWTATDGSYLFDELPADDYVIVQGDGSNELDVDGAGNGYDNIAVTLSAGEHETGRDFLLPTGTATSSISGQVRDDDDSDGDPGDSDDPASGITIQLYTDPNGNGDPSDGILIGTATTDGSGSYTFSNLIDGSYVVVETDPTDATSTYDVDAPLTDNQIAVTLSGTDSTGNDFLDQIPKPNTFEAWQTDNPLGGNNGPNENPDGDLYDNLMEYALCLHPNSGIPNHDGFCVEHTAGQFDAVFRRATGGLSDLTYTLQGRSTLPVSGDTSWTTIATIPGQGAGASGATITDLGDDSEEVRLTNIQSASPLSATAGFVRLLVTKGTDSSVTLVQGWLETLHKTNQCATYSVPFVKKEALSGAITSVVFNSVNVGESADLSTILDFANNSYYLEIIEGDHEGHRFDIASAGAGSLTLSADGNLCAGPPYNTLTSLPPTLSGDRYVVRAHYTINELFPPASPFSAGATASVADRLLFYSDSWDVYYLDSVADPDVWQLDGEAFADYGGTLVPPNQGLFLHPRTGDITLLSIGIVRENTFALPLNSDYTLIPSVYPVDQSPNDRALLTTYGTYAIDGGFDPAKADQISVWDGDDDSTYVEGYSAYFHLQGAGGSGFPDGWRDSSDAFLAPQSDTKLFKRNRSAFLLRRSKDCDTTYMMPLPWHSGQ